jgi:hypothetical protein
MATFRNFADINGETIELKSHRINSMKNAEFAERFPGIKGRRYDSFSRMVSEDAEGRVLPITRSIERKSRPSNHKCDARCLHAKGFRCECECGGKNHGRGNFMCEAA